MHKHQGAEHPEKLQTLQFTQKKSCTQLKVLNDRGHIYWMEQKLRKREMYQSYGQARNIGGAPTLQPRGCGRVGKNTTAKAKSLFSCLRKKKTMSAYN
jgi:hypothetical protein